LIAIPDFVSGAMEHWGLITFRETNMLVDEATSAVSSLQQVGMVVAHELAHMWFGNLGNFILPTYIYISFSLLSLFC
jgi:glutamyl aminopeptidase